MRHLLLAMAVLPLASAARGAIAYTRFAHPKGDYVIEYPSNWKKSYGLQTVSLRPPGLDGKKAKVSLGRYPLGKGTPVKPEDFEKELLAQVGTLKRLDSQTSIDFAGHKVHRLALTETVALTGSYGRRLTGPLQEVYVILPVDNSAYYVLKLEGIGDAFAIVLPEFDLITQKLTLAAATPKAPQPQ